MDLPGDEIASAYTRIVKSAEHQGFILLACAIDPVNEPGRGEHVHVKAVFQRAMHDRMIDVIRQRDPYGDYIRGLNAVTPRWATDERGLYWRFGIEEGDLFACVITLFSSERNQIEVD
jgi:hypothetical protein